MALTPLNIIEEQGAPTLIPMPAPSTTQTDATFPAEFKAGMQLWNPTSAVMTKIPDQLNQDQDPEDGYDYKLQIQNTPYEQWADKFAQTINTDQAERLKKQIDKELQNQTILSHAGTTAQVFTGLAAGILDPTLVIPLTSGFKLTKAASNIARGVAEGAATSIAAVGTQEAMLRENVATRTDEESKYALLTAGILGGALGGAATGLASARAAQIYKSALKGDPLALSDVKLNSSVGAADALGSIPEDNRLISTVPNWMKEHPKVAAVWDKMIYATSHLPFVEAPSMRGLRNELKTVRQFTSDIFDVTQQLQTDVRQAHDIPWETKEYADMVDLSHYNQKIESAYSEYLSELGNKKLPKQNFNQFNEALAKAFNRPDELSGFNSIDRMTKHFRAEMKKATDDLVKNGRLSEDQAKLMQDGDLTRMWDRDRVRDYRDNLHGILKSWILDNMNTSGEKNLQLEDKITYAHQYANQAIDHILGLTENVSGMMELTKAISDKGVRFTKSRSLNIPNKLVEKFIVNDFQHLSSQVLQQSRRMNRYYELLNKYGANSVDDLHKIMLQEYERKVNILDKNNPAIAELGKNLQDGKELINDSIKVMLGQYQRFGKADRFFRSLKNYTHARVMGMATISAITDLAMPIFTQGMKPTIQGWKTFATRVFDADIAKASKADLNKIGTLLDIQSNGILESLVRREEANISKAGRFEGYSATLADLVTKFSGMNHWNALGKSITTWTASHNIMNMLLKAEQNGFDSLSEANKIFLHSHYIGQEDIQAILGQFRKHGITKDDLHILNIDHWDIPAVQEKVLAAIQKSINETIIKPSKGDIPFIMQGSAFGRMVWHLRGFFTGASGKIWYRAMQERNGRAVGGLSALMALGMAQYVIRNKLQGKEVDTSPSRLALEGLNRSGILGIMNDPIFGLLLSNFYVPGRLAQQSREEYFMGPSYGTIKAINNAYGSAVKGLTDPNYDPLSKENIDKFIKILPLQNLPPIDMLLRNQGIRGQR